MNSPDPTSLDLLHDLVTPPPTPFWPPAPGWLWLLAVLVVVLAVLALRGFARWQANRYRREALAELSRIERDLAKPDASRAALLDLSELLKRVAITAYGRVRVARLTGDEWFAFLDQAGATTFSQGLGAAMARALYVGVDPADAKAVVDKAKLVAEARQWIRTHPLC